MHPYGIASAYFARLSLRVSVFHWANMITEIRSVLSGEAIFTPMMWHLIKKNVYKANVVMEPCQPNRGSPKAALLLGFPLTVPDQRHMQRFIYVL